MRAAASCSLEKLGFAVCARSIVAVSDAILLCQSVSAVEQEEVRVLADVFELCASEGHEGQRLGLDLPLRLGWKQYTCTSAGRLRLGTVTTFNLLGHATPRKSPHVDNFLYSHHTVVAVASRRPFSKLNSRYIDDSYKTLRINTSTHPRFHSLTPPCAGTYSSSCAFFGSTTLPSSSISSISIDT